MTLWLLRPVSIAINQYYNINSFESLENLFWIEGFQRKWHGTAVAEIPFEL